MEYYIATRYAMLQNGNLTIQKDDIFDSSQATKENIERWLKNGYIKKLGNRPDEDIKTKKKKGE